MTNSQPCDIIKVRGVGMEKDIARILLLVGMWLLSDGWFSLSLYMGKENQSWIKDHSIRIIRIVIGVGLIIIGWMP